MSQTQPVTAVETPATAVQQPAPAYDRDHTAGVPNNPSPAPASELPTALNNTEPITAAPPPANEKAADQKMAPPPPTIQGVTPLHMLSDSPQWIDCPFCAKRTMTSVTTEGTGMQMVAGALCCLLCVCLTCVPCMAGWCEITHFSCSNCHKRVATRPYDGPIQIFGPQGPMYPAVPSQYEPMAPPKAEQQGLPAYK